MNKIKELLSKTIVNIKLAASKKNMITMGVSLALSVVCLFGVMKLSALLITLYLGYELVKNAK